MIKKTKTVSPGLAKLSIASCIEDVWLPAPEPTYHVLPALTTSVSKEINPKNPAVTSKHTITIEVNLLFVLTLLCPQDY